MNNIAQITTLSIHTPHSQSCTHSHHTSTRHRTHHTHHTHAFSCASSPPVGTRCRLPAIKMPRFQPVPDRIVLVVVAMHGCCHSSRANKQLPGSHPRTGTTLAPLLYMYCTSTCTPTCMFYLHTQRSTLPWNLRAPDSVGWILTLICGRQTLVASRRARLRLCPPS